MKASFKDRGIVLAWLMVFVVVISAVLYVTFAKPGVTGIITNGVQLVKNDEIQQIEDYKKHYTSYAIKLQENGKFSLKYYYYESNQPKESKFEITSEQYNKLVEGKPYWFTIQFAKKNDPSSGIVKGISDINPIR